MRLLHFADLHLGVENYSGGINPESGLSWRFSDFTDALDQVVQYALDQHIDLVLFCGDAYKSRDPSQTQQREFARRIWRLASSGIPVFLLTGNHDLPNAVGRATAMEIFHTLEVENVTVASTPGTYHLQTASGRLQVVALPWARRHALLSREESKGLTLEQVNERVEAILTERLELEIEKLDPQVPAVLAAHVSLSNATAGSERSMVMGHDYVLLHSNVAHPAFDYVALGHIHRRQVLGQEPPVAYPGSLQPIDFSEEGDEKGFFVVDIQRKGQVNFDFQPVKARRFLTIKVNIGQQEADPTAAVLAAIAQHDVSDAVVRVQIAVPQRLAAHLSDVEIRRALKEAHYIAAIAREVEREQRPRMAGFSAEGVTPLQALKAYIEVNKPRVKPELLLEYGQRLINESMAQD